MQSAAALIADIGRRKSSSAHQHLPVLAPQSNSVPQRAQTSRRGSGLFSVDRFITDI
jgi:hypothetical protein